MPYLFRPIHDRKEIRMADTRAIPNTDDFRIASLAVAWEIVSAAYDFRNMNEPKEKRVTILTNAVIKSFEAILNQNPIEK